jgi:FixJ family two-component response regulator
MTQKNIVAIVSHNPKMLDALDRMVSAHGFYPQTFASAESFAYGAATSDAACVLLNIPLGDTAALSLMRRLRAGGYMVPFVTLVESREETMRLQARKVERTDYVHKPFFSDQLIETIRNAMASEGVAASS